MRKSNLFISFGFILALLGCGDKTSSTLSFDIKNYDGTAPRVSVGPYYSEKATIDSLGKGSLEIPLTGATFATVELKRSTKRTIYLEAGKDLSLSYDLGEGAKKVSFEGELAQESAFLQDNNFYAKNPLVPRERRFEVLLRRTDSVAEINARQLAETNFSETFKSWEKRRLTAEHLNRILRLSFIHSDACQQTVKERFVEDSNYLKVPEYLELLDQYVVRRLIRTSNRPAIEIILENVSDDAVRSYLVDQVYFTRTQPRDREIYRQFVKDPKRLAAYATACEKTDHLLPGKPCPDFRFKDINGKEVSLADLKGKFVYIYMWATWCGPCKGEMPSLLKLEEEFAGKDITFVSLSVDQNKDIEKWKKTVKDMKLGGIQLHLGENWEWLKTFMPASMSVPRFVILDREGNFVDSDAIRPSDPKAKETLESLLK